MLVSDLKVLSHTFISQMSLSPVSVSRSSISSTISQYGTIAWAWPPVAMKLRLGAELALDPAGDRVDRPGEPVDEPGLQALRGALADHAAGLAERLAELDRRELRGALGERLHRDRDAGADHAAEVLAVGRDRVEGDRGAEVDDGAGVAEAVVGGDGVDEAVGAELERVVEPDRHPGLDARADDQAARARSSARTSPRSPA